MKYSNVMNQTMMTGMVTIGIKPMKNEFIKVYEELSQLNEAKQDTLNFKNWLRAKGASESEADNYTKRFDSIKSMLKSPENDYYYWIKKMEPQDLFNVINNTERVAKVKRTRKQEIAEGAKLVNETEHWKIYHITNFDASQYYGRDSRWCITGVDSYGDKYWNDYTRDGYTFYFCIAKQDYDPRGENSKFAIAIHEEAECYRVFDQQDNEDYLEDIPYYEEIKIPGINLDYYENREPRYCEECGEYLSEDDEYWGEDGDNVYCESCWHEYFFRCYECGETYKQDDVYTGTDGDEYCYDCWSDKFFECSQCCLVFEIDEVNWDDNGEGYCNDCWEELLEENEMLDDFEDEDDDEE